MSGDSGTDSGPNALATLDIADPAPPCQSTTGTSVWWARTPPTNSTSSLDTLGSDFDTVLSVHTGASLAASTEEACNDDISFPANPESSLSFGASAGTTYLVRVAGFDSAIGNITLNYDIDDVPPCNGLDVTVEIGLGQSPTEGADVILGTEGADVIDGLGGDDTICGLGGDDVIDGGDGLDTIFGDGGVDTIDGGLGNDTIQGGDDADDIYGAGGGDRIFGDGGDDLLRGGNGNDQIEGGSGADEIRGQNGSDLVYANTPTDFSTVDVDTVYGGGLYDDVYGDDGDDVMYGGNNADTLSGKAGDDTLFGNNGADTLRGGPHVVGDYCNGGTMNSSTGDIANACETVINVP
jgi:Ca2+-binding RTX toxin-like protein